MNEINCRLQGTSEVSTINQVQREFPPFYLLHLAIFLGIELSNEIHCDTLFNRSTQQQMIQKTQPAPFYLNIPNLNPNPLQIHSSFKGSSLYQLCSFENSNLMKNQNKRKNHLLTPEKVIPIIHSHNLILFLKEML